MSYTLSELAERIGAVVQGKGDAAVEGISSAAHAGPRDLVFASDAAWLAAAEASAAGAILATTGSTSAKPLLLVPEVQQALAALLPLFEREVGLAAGISAQATIDPSAQVAETAAIGPFVVIGARAVIAAGVRIHPHCYVGEDCVIGGDSTLYPCVTIMPRSIIGARCLLHAGCVVGEAGFGFRFEGGRHVPIPQVGNVVLGDDVEVGANTTIDRAMVGSTLIGSGTKIDNLVQLGHNVQVGKNCMIIAQTGVSGSSELGDFVVLAGQVGVTDHVKLGNGVRVGAQSGVSKSFREAGDYWGFPARPIKDAFEVMAATNRTPKMLKEIRELRARLEKLEKQLE